MDPALIGWNVASVLVGCVTGGLVMRKGVVSKEVCKKCNDGLVEKVDGLKGYIDDVHDTGKETRDTVMLIAGAMGVKVPPKAPDGGP